MTAQSAETPAISFALSAVDGLWHVFVKPVGKPAHTVASFPSPRDAWRAAAALRKAPLQSASQNANDGAAAA